MSPRDILLVLLVCLAWAGNFLSSAHALTELPPLLFTALRLALLSVLLAPFLRAPAPGQWPRLLAICLSTGVLHFGLSFWALKLAGDLASPAVAMQSYVPMAALLAWWWLGERFAWRTGTAIALSFAGILVLGLDPLVLDAPASLALMLVSAFFLAVGTVLMRGLAGQSLFSQQGWIAVVGVLPLFGLSALLEPGAWAAAGEAGWKGWGGVAYSALVSSLFGHGMYYLLVRRYPVAMVTPWLLLAPVMAIGLGIAFWGDRPGPRLWLGAAMVLGGVLAIAMRGRARARPVPAAEDI
ncbi:DMT family transporter [Arenimonas fontis]|uniref:DMT family transporter n=1 Tax=Arenimonas fontis TaxID=2608255 RepID=A0A5B2ZAP3_9GAMM|nr:DMT family transporter [Arenimonas fontis]KAA2285027.1 DMT family transporter [Arenimonas fontis]